MVQSGSGSKHAVQKRRAECPAVVSSVIRAAAFVIRMRADAGARYELCAIQSARLSVFGALLQAGQGFAEPIGLGCVRHASSKASAPRPANMAIRTRAALNRAASSVCADVVAVEIFQLLEIEARCRLTNGIHIEPFDHVLKLT
jgi:hypothetical protein